ncbi:hypothetical protein ABE356_000215 [Escherichia coli]|nr:hypothetical protein [Escherichia coli]
MHLKNGYKSQAFKNPLIGDFDQNKYLTALEKDVEFWREKAKTEQENIVETNLDNAWNLIAELSRRVAKLEAKAEPAPPFKIEFEKINGGFKPQFYIADLKFKNHHHYHKVLDLISRYNAGEIA